MEKPDSKVNQSKAAQSHEFKPGMPHSSPGDESVSVTPKDVWPGQASAKDVTERKTYSDDQDERQEALLDEANDLSFPASDPISVPSYTRIEASPHEPPAPQRSGAHIVVHNTRPDVPRVTLFGQLNDGSYIAEVMDEDAVPYTLYWDNAIDQCVVYIEPENDQLERIVNALNEGRLEFSHLQDFGSVNGESSTIHI